MKRSNKSWIRQLSESYIRQALSEDEGISGYADAVKKDQQGEHHDGLQTHLDNAHSEYDGYADEYRPSAVPHLQQAHALLSAGHGSERQKQSFDYIMGGLGSDKERNKVTNR